MQPSLTIPPINQDEDGKGLINGLMFLRIYCSLEILNPNVWVIAAKRGV